MSANSKLLIINNREFHYSEVELYEGTKKINTEIARENLKKFNSILEETEIKYGLYFGTLLGAIREKHFIEYDEDTDIFVLGEYKDSFMNLLFKFREVNLELIRYKEHYLSLMSNNEYIDVYFFYERKRFFVKKRIHNNRDVINARYLDNLVKIDFLGMNIPVPNQSKKVLKILYGKNWRIPLENCKAQPNSFNAKLSVKLSFLRSLPFYTNMVKVYKSLFFK